MNLRTFIRTALAAFAALFIIATCTRCATLSDADKAHVAQDGVQIITCAAEAHLCKKFEQNGSPDAGLSKCWDEYDACLASHGFRDAGKDGAK